MGPWKLSLSLMNALQGGSSVALWPFQPLKKTINPWDQDANDALTGANLP